MPCNHPRHAHIWPREGLLNIKSCERRCFFCDHAALGSAVLLEQHVHEEHVLPDPSGAADLPRLTVVGFPQSPLASEANAFPGDVVMSDEGDAPSIPTGIQHQARQKNAPCRRDRRAFYHRIVITSHVDLDDDGDEGAESDQTGDDEEPTRKEDQEDASEQTEDPESDEVPNFGAGHKTAKRKRGRATRRGAARDSTKRTRVDSAGPYED